MEGTTNATTHAVRARARGNAALGGDARARAVSEMSARRGVDVRVRVRRTVRLEGVGEREDERPEEETKICG